MCYDNYQAGYYCQHCGTWHYYLNNWTTPITQSGDIVPIKHYKCPKCKGEFSEVGTKFTGRYKEEDIKEFGSEVVIAKQKVPVYKYACPFCSKEMKGLN